MPGALALVLVLDVALVLAIAFDFLRTPAPARLDVRRSLPDSAGLSQDFVRRVRIQAAGPAAGLELELREEFAPAFSVRARTNLAARARTNPAPDRRGTAPREWEGSGPGLERADPGDPTGGPDRVLLPMDGPIDILRVYRSERRGEQWIGDMRLRLRGPLGLVRRQARLAGRSRIAIEPALLGLSHTLRLAASDRWHDLGVRRLRRRGGLTEFESLRDYVEGDDVRLIDWKAFARRGRPTVRDYQEEQGQELLLVIDCGRRMGATTAEGAERGWTKLDHALDAALQLAAVALSKGDRVGVAAFDAAVRVFVAPRRGRRQLARLREAVFALEPSGLESDLARALREIAVRQPRRAMLLILSDVADPFSIDRQRTALRAGARHHRILFAGLDDPALRKVAEGAQPAPAAVRSAAIGLAEERAAGLRRLAGSGVRVLDTVPAETAGPLLAAWLDARRSGVV